MNIVVGIRAHGGQIRQATLKLEGGSQQPCSIECEGKVYEGGDFFECLQKLREETLEPAGDAILCNGARLDTYPSGMARDMGAGLKVYLLTSAQPGRPSLLETFGAAPAETIATVADQRRHFESWLAARGGFGQLASDEEV